MELTQNIVNAISSGVVSARWLIWFKARNRTTGLVEQAGISTLDYDMTLNVNGQSRTYAGAGPVLGMPEMTYESGTVIQNQRLSLSILDPNVINLIRAYDSSFAPVEFHIVFFNHLNGEVIGTALAYSGTVDTIHIKEGAQASCDVVIASLNRNGTRTLSLKKSDAAQKLRDPNDNGRKYASIAGTVEVAWGSEGDGNHRRNTLRPFIRVASKGLSGDR